MKFVDEYRAAPAVTALADDIHRVTKHDWTIMEVCGGQTHAIVKYGLDELLPDRITLVHGPGCPVCVTSAGLIDLALKLAAQPGVIFCSFGDMLRVPGSRRVDLQAVKAAGGDVRTVYSPLDALQLAEANPDREVVFFAVGFETTAPANAMAAYQAQQRQVRNFSLLVAQVLVPPAMRAILDAPDNRVQAFLAAGHVCTVMGFWEYEQLAQDYRVPFVVTGFEPLDLLQGIHMAVQQLERGQSIVENQYSRVVRRQGNLEAQALIGQVFEVTDREWRGLGLIPASGLRLQDAYRDLDAQRRFQLTIDTSEAESECISGRVLQGLKKPVECPAFGTRCTPEHPLGATMVSAEGACAAYYRYRGLHREDSTS